MWERHTGHMPEIRKIMEGEKAMPSSKRKSCFKAAGICVLALMAGSVASGAEKRKLPDGPGKEATIRLCGTCHGAELVMNRRESFEGWNGVIEDMIIRGAKGSSEEFGEVVDYLVAHFPKKAGGNRIAVNKATAKDLAAKLGIPDEQASAIVQHREAKGNFKALEDLLKVEGLDAVAVEGKKDKLDF